ncbi:MAG: poly-gamma-glutamate biosynthesis protein PgsC [Gemmatimonadetes bacterium]|nr:MAG: poly-gamma-glutamate biosynthesis protein PgsC [Gemmatimonadota bacterium]
MIEQALSLGFLLSLIFTEFFGLASGGMIVPGYMALMLHQPSSVIVSILIALVVYYLIRALSNFVFLFGRRQIILCMLFGFILSIPNHFLIQQWVIGDLIIPLYPVGYIIPGLLAYWMVRNGVMQTISMMLVAAILIRLTLILMRGGETFPELDYFVAISSKEVLMWIAIGIGILLNFAIGEEFFNLMAGGIVVPGYIAMTLHNAGAIGEVGTKLLSIVPTLLVAVLIYGVVRWGISQIAFIYGRRQMVICILLGFFFVHLMDAAPALALGSGTAGTELELRVIGSIIPGLIAHWMLRRGLRTTLLLLVVVSILVRLCVVVIEELFFLI